MSTLVWDSVGERTYEAGVDRGVFYPLVSPGLAWSGLISVNETTEGEEQTFIYYDGQRVRNQLTIGHFSASLSALTYPSEFDTHQGPFGFSYRTGLGDDLENLDRGYKIHIVYNALAAPSNKHHSTIGSDLEPLVFEWDISTTPVPVQFARPTAHLIIDSTRVHAGVMDAIEDLIYGTDTTQPTFPTVQEILDIFDQFALFVIIDHGDGTFTASGPDDAVFLTSPTEFQLSWPSVVMISEDTYRASTF